MKKKKLINNYVLVTLIFLITIFFAYYYFSYKYGFSIPCIFHTLTGFHCPGCGITRMLFSLVTLNFYQAFRYNILLFVSLPFIIILFSDYLFKNIIGKDNYLYIRVSKKTWLILLIIVILFGVFRNIPGFEYLKPTDIL